MTRTTSANWTALDAGSTQGNTIYLIGSGTVNATGGNAANGGNGMNGSDASYSSQEDAAWVGVVKD